MGSARGNARSQHTNARSSREREGQRPLTAMSKARISQPAAWSSSARPTEVSCTIDTMNILSLEAIHKQFADRPLLDGVTLGIDAGERVGVVGVNGSGKTTLLRIVAGAESSDSGRVSMTRDLRVAYLPQNPVLEPDLTVIEQIFRGDAPEIRLLREYERAADALAHTPGDQELQQTMAVLVARMDAADTWALENDARTILA